MGATLTSGSTTIAPIAFSDYTSEQEGGSIRHEILGRTNPDVTLRPAGLRTGSFTLDFASETASSSARTALTAAAAWTLTHTERTSVNMRFIPRRISRPVDAGGRWVVTVSYEEIGT